MWIYTIAILNFLIFLIYKWMTKDFGKFEKFGAFSVKPVLFFGNQLDLYTGKAGFMDEMFRFYDIYKPHR